MLCAIPILLRGDDDAIKVIFFIIVGVIWLISAIASSRKKQKTEKTEQDWQKVLEQMGQQPGHSGPHAPPSRPAPAPPPPMPRQTMQPAPPPRPKPPKQRPPRQPQRRPAPVEPAATPAPEAQLHSHMAPSTEPDAYALLASQKNVIESKQISSEVAKPAAAVPSASAASIARWLKPATMRGQFILTEILQPPLAIRERSADDPGITR